MKYVANPVLVDAFEISAVGSREADNSRDILHAGGRGLATAEMLSRYTPKPGDFWVVQADGYVYLNPRAVFLRKYSPVSS